jgi:hypothetical protein
MLRTIWGDNERYLSTYWHRFQNRYYVAGDSAHRDSDGYYWIMGRIDDVLNVAGHRLGTMEIESALVAHPRVAEAAVVGKQHDIKGESVFAYVVLNGQRPTGEAAVLLIAQLRDWVSEQLSPIAKPDEIRLTDNLPKTRSGKIMRRLLRAIARGEEITQDVSTLENPAILEQLRGQPEGAGAAAAPGRTRGPASGRKPAGGKAVKPVEPAKPVKAVKRAKPAKVPKAVRRGKSGKGGKDVKPAKALQRAKIVKRAKAAKRPKPVSRAKAAKRAKTVRRTQPAIRAKGAKAVKKQAGAKRPKPRGSR